MASLIARLWSLPWPPVLRRHTQQLTGVNLLRRLVLPQFTVGISGLIWNERGELLLVRQTYQARHPWSLPGGFLEHHEQPAAALVREVSEEAGLAVTVGELLGAHADPYHHHLTLVYNGRSAGGQFEPNVEISAARFFAVTELPDIAQHQRAIVEQFRLQEVSH